MKQVKTIVMVAAGVLMGFFLPRVVFAKNPEPLGVQIRLPQPNKEQTPVKQSKSAQVKKTKPSSKKHVKKGPAPSRSQQSRDREEDIRNRLSNRS